jgi:hypothetical protein
MKNSRPGSNPMASPKRTGNIKHPNVGAAIPSRPMGQGPSGTHGSYASGKKPGTRMAK